MSFLLRTTLKMNDSAFSPFLNTGTLFDFATGRYIPGLMGSTILLGGIGLTNGITGKPQVFKSTQAHGLAVNILARYPQSEYLIYDSEFSQGDKERLARASDMYLDDPIKREAHILDLIERIVVINPEDEDLESFFARVKMVAKAKNDNKKDFIVECPFNDPRTNKPMQMYIPTLVAFDSWSESHALSAMESLNDKDASDSKNNTWFMGDGRVKKLIMSQLPSLAAKYGIYFILTAHIGKVVDMGSFMPTPKDMQYTKQGETLKGVGSAFSFAVGNVIEARKAVPIVIDGGKESQYRVPGSPMTHPTEFSRVDDVVIRCKNNNSGTHFSLVMSQKFGLNNNLTNFDALREAKYYGLGGPNAARNPRPVLLPDVVLPRTQVLEKMNNSYEVARAVELLAQLLTVQTKWTLEDQVVNFSITPEELAEKIHKGGYLMSDILNTRGYWSYGEHERPYLSLFDIVAMIEGKYKPKFIKVGTPAKATA